MDDKAIEKTNKMDVNPENLISQAISKGMAVETIEKLLIMRKELKAEWSKEQYYKSLASFQGECPVINKEQEVKQDGKVRYKYVSLDNIVNQVKDLLNKNGFSYTIKPRFNEKSVIAICHSFHVDGHEEITECEMPIDLKSYMNITQKIGSSLTYAKRYAFCNAFGIITGDEDTDANDNEDKKDNKIIVPDINIQTGKSEIRKKFEKLKEPENKRDPRIQELLDKAEPYKNKFTPSQIKFFLGLKKKDTYTEIEYIEDLKLVEEFLDNLEKEKNIAIDDNDIENPNLPDLIDDMGEV